MSITLILRRNGDPTAPEYSNASFTYMTPTGIVEGALAWDACTTSNNYC